MSRGGGSTRYLAMKTSMSRRAAMLEAGSGGHDEEYNDGDSMQRPRHGHPTSQEHFVIARDVTSLLAAPVGVSAAKHTRIYYLVRLYREQFDHVCILMAL